MDKQAISFVMGKRLKELREERLLSHDKLKDQLKEKYGISVSRDSLMAYEISDETRAKADKLPNMGMRVEYLYCLADFYGVSLDYLLGKTTVKVADCSMQYMSDYTGLSEASINILHSATNFLLRDSEISTAYILSKIIESHCFPCLINNLAQSMFCGAYLPNITHTVKISKEDDEKMLNWARDNGYEIVGRDAVYEMHLQCAANNLSDLWHEVVSDEAEKMHNSV